MKQLTISQKLTFGFTMAVITLSIVAATGITQLLQVDEGYRFQVLPQIEHESSMVTLDEYVYEIKILQLEFAKSQNLSLMNQAADLIEKSNQKLDSIIETSSDIADQAIYQEVKQLFVKQGSLINKLAQIQTKRGSSSTTGQVGRLNKNSKELDQYFISHDFSSGYILIFRANSLLSKFRGNKNQARRIAPILEQLPLGLQANPKLLAIAENIVADFTKYQKNNNRRLLARVKKNLGLLESGFKRGYIPNAVAEYERLKKAEQVFLINGDLNLINDIHQSIENITNAIALSSLRGEKKQSLNSSVNSYYDNFNLLMESQVDLLDTNEELLQNAKLIHLNLDKALLKEQSETKQLIGGIQGQSEFAVNFMAIASAVGVVTIILFAIIFIGKISTLLVGLAANLNTAATEVAQASGEISNSSIELSQGASTQAATFEETSAAIEQLSSQTQQNANIATETSKEMITIAQMVKNSAASSDQAYTISQEASEAAQQGVAAMVKIDTAMQEIGVSSNKIADIISVLNEITHQTKMLATNAAIEAARAGESGKGFAVVADEVSKLAENSKSSAKEISILIKESFAKTQFGIEQVYLGDQVLSKILDKTNQATDIISDIRKNSNLQAESIEELNHKVAQITVASNEQALGVEQIAKAIVDVDQVTQTNSANAENTASASEELAAQANILQELVQEVVVHVGGKHTTPQGSGKKKQPKVAQVERSEKPLALGAPSKNPLADWGKSTAKGKSISSKEKVRLRDDFRDF